MVADFPLAKRQLDDLKSKPHKLIVLCYQYHVSYIYIHIIYICISLCMMFVFVAGSMFIPLPGEARELRVHGYIQGLVDIPISLWIVVSLIPIFRYQPRRHVEATQLSLLVYKRMDFSVVIGPPFLPAINHSIHQVYVNLATINQRSIPWITIVVGEIAMSYKVGPPFTIAFSWRK